MTTMTVEEVAQMLNGLEYHEYRKKISEISTQLKVNNIVVVYGESDDLIEFEGAIFDEGDCFDGGRIAFNAKGIVEEGDPSANWITAKFCEDITDDGEKITWSYETDIFHETFMIFSEGEPFCEGIVFSMNNIRYKDATDRRSTLKEAEEQKESMKQNERLIMEALEQTAKLQGALCHAYKSGMGDRTMGRTAKGNAADVMKNYKNLCVAMDKIREAISDEGELP